MPSPESAGAIAVLRSRADTGTQRWDWRGGRGPLALGSSSPALPATGEPRALAPHSLHHTIGNDLVCGTEAGLATDASAVVSTGTGIVQILDWSNHFKAVVPSPGTPIDVAALESVKFFDLVGTENLWITIGKDGGAEIPGPLPRWSQALDRHTLQVRRSRGPSTTRRDRTG